MSEAGPIGYIATAYTLKDRIKALIPDHPEILTIESAWNLFGIDGFYCADLGPTLAQAGSALAVARREYITKDETDDA